MDGRQVELAERLARRLHRDQTDKAGAPYVGHLSRVVEHVETPRARAIAWLHDVLEDTDVRESDLVADGVDPSVVAGVDVVTRRVMETYADFVARVAGSGDADAVAVKLADVEDHLVDTTCIPASLRRRYERALPVLAAT